MKTKNNPNVKRISTAMRIGAQIAKENGIKKGTGELFETNLKGEIKCACALGMAYIGLYGLKGAEASNTILSKKFKLDDSKLECLLKTTKSPAVASANDAEDFIVLLNDDSNLHPRQIAEKLASCGL